MLDSRIRYAFQIQCPIDTEVKKCWNWKGTIAKNGYGYFGVRINGKDKKFLAHVISYLIHHNLDSVDLYVLHKCIGNRRCVNPHHLYLGTHLDNIRDMVNQGRNVSNFPKSGMLGDANPQTKIIDSEIAAILASSLSDSELAKLYGVHRVTINRIRNRKQR